MGVNNLYWDPCSEELYLTGDQALLSTWTNNIINTLLDYTITIISPHKNIKKKLIIECLEPNFSFWMYTLLHIY